MATAAQADNDDGPINGQRRTQSIARLPVWVAWVISSSQLATR
jgi:hypothetical protein